MRPKEASSLCASTTVSIAEVLEVETSQVNLTPVTSTVDIMELYKLLLDLILPALFGVHRALGLKCCTVKP